MITGPINLIRIQPEFSKEDFLRKAWITLTKEDAPFEVFDQNFSEPTVTAHRILIDKIDFEASWQANIGNDRQEAYTAYETYYEKIPYTDYETRTVNGVQKQVAVTKYRQEERQRAVTKYKTVTDWSFSSGIHRDTSVATVETFPHVSLDAYRFLKDYGDTKDRFVSFVMDGADPDLTFTESTRSFATSKHSDIISMRVNRALPGDHQKDVSYDVTNIDVRSSDFIKASEYETSLSYRGQTYTKSAFPFGKMRMVGNAPENLESIEEKKKEVDTRLAHDIKQRRLQAKKTITKKSLVPGILSLLTIVLSILCSLFVPRLIAVIATFAAALVLFVTSLILYKVFDSKENSKMDKDILQLTLVAKDEIKNYASKHSEQLLAALNKKLASLGLKEATMDEIKGGAQE